MIRRPPRSTQSRSSAASDVYKRQEEGDPVFTISDLLPHLSKEQDRRPLADGVKGEELNIPVSYTHLRAHETRHDLVCRLLLEKKKKKESRLLLETKKNT